VTNWFHRASGVADAKGRVGHYPGRFEAESMALDGYTVADVTPWEDASGGKAVACASGATCTATLKFSGAPGWYTVRVQYFDTSNGVSQYRLSVNRQIVDEWQADLRLPTVKLDSTSSTRRTSTALALRPGDEIRLEGRSGGGEQAAIDYLEIVPAR